MGRAMMTNQVLPSGAGFKVVKIVDKHTWPATTPHFHELKKWCRDNCSGIWGYTPHPRQVRRTTIPDPDKRGYVNWNENYVDESYFAFADAEDITMIGLFLGLGDQLVLRAMWPSSIKFNIFYDTDDDIEYSKDYEDPEPFPPYLTPYKKKEKS